jgi:lipoprotein LprG
MAGPPRLAGPAGFGSVARVAGASGVAAAIVLVLAGCGASGGGLAPTVALKEAKQHLDQTSGVHFALDSTDLPAGVTAVSKADGVLTRAPAFQGSITVPVMGIGATVQIIAVGGKVWAKLPFTSSFQTIDPAQYGAPDPQSLLDPATGIASLLPATTALSAGDSHRGGVGNKEILTDYHGTVPGATVSHVIPGSTGDFAATYTIDGDGYLSQAVLTGHFDGAATAPSTYTVTVTAYGTTQQITAP